MHLFAASQQRIVLICLVVFLCAFTLGICFPVNPHDAKRPICCNNLTSEKPTNQITKCYIFPAKGKCDAAVVFIDIKNRLYCIDPEAEWVSKRINRLKKRGVICEDFTKS